MTPRHKFRSHAIEFLDIALNGTRHQLAREILVHTRTFLVDLDDGHWPEEYFLEKPYDAIALADALQRQADGLDQICVNCGNRAGHRVEIP